MTDDLASLYPGFAARHVPVGGGVQLHTLTGGEGPPLLLVHGHPQTLAIWHKVAPRLARHFSLVLVDLRGYGDSAKPAPGEGGEAYAKRLMAADLLAVMRHLGHARFAVLAEPQ